MVIAINKLCIELTGGEEFGGKSNMYEGQSLGFVEGIVINKIFGKKRYKTIFHQAAAYLYFVLKNHPFVDGNKRTALATAVTFLEWNDRIFSPFNEDEVFDFINGKKEEMNGRYNLNLNLRIIKTPENYLLP